jgi:hypothetical protein
MAANDLVKLEGGKTPTGIIGAPGLDVWETLAKTNPGRPGWLRDSNNRPVQMATPEGAAAAADIAFRGIETASRYGAIFQKYTQALAAKPSLAQDRAFVDSLVDAKIAFAQSITVAIGGLIFLSDIGTVVPLDVNITTPYMRSKGHISPLGKNWSLGRTMGSVTIATSSDWRTLATRLQEAVAKLQDRPIEGTVRLAPRLSKENMRGMSGVNGVYGRRGMAANWTFGDIAMITIGILVVAAAVVFTGGLAAGLGLSLTASIASYGVVGLVVGGAVFAMIATKYTSELYSQKLTADAARLDKLTDNKIDLINKLANETDPDKRAAIKDALGENAAAIEAAYKSPDIDPFGLKGMMGGAKTLAYVVGGAAAVGALVSLVKTFKSKQE